MYLKSTLRVASIPNSIICTYIETFYNNIQYTASGMGKILLYNTNFSVN